MTEGIIQKIFKEYLVYGRKGFKTRFTRKDLIKIEQELIEEIREQSHKQSYEDKDGKWSYEYEELRARHKFRDELIGDIK